jgi:hypothetical protein
MRKITACVALVGLIILSGCSSDSKNAPPVPTPATATWSITSLTTSSTSAQVNSVILVTAVVTRDGSSAPDGTAVEFLATGGYFVSSALTSAEVATEDGSAVVQFWAEDAGSYTLQARVGDAIRQVAVSYFHPSQSDALQIYSISPSEGPMTGGQLAYITGKNIDAPVDVYFTINGSEFQAVTIDVSTTGEAVTITTPEITGLDMAQEWTASVRVESRAGLGDGDTYTFPDAYRFSPAISEPIIYILNPSHGSPRGGEMINIIGQNFIEPVRVTLGTLEVGEETVSPDGQLISFMTPQYSVEQLTADVVVDVTVFSESGTAREKSVIKTSGFQFDAEILTPEITGIDPIGGPLDGGTVVTIFGSGFSIPVQVLFGDREATVTDVREDRIVCVSPDYSTVADTVPITVEVTVSNLNTGLTSDAASFTYGENLFISGNDPTEGPSGTAVTIYGSGFEDPLIVDWSGRRLETIAVSGTEIVVLFASDMPSCGGETGTFTVTLLDSNQTVSGGTFKLDDAPAVFSVAPVVITEINDTGAIDTPEITIRGRNFSDEVLITIGGNPVAQSNIQVVDSETITVTVPTPTELGLVWDTGACTTSGGEVGTMNVATSVDINVTNLPSNCPATGAVSLLYQPYDTECVAAATPPAINVSPTSLDFGDTTVFGDTATLDLTIANDGEEVLIIYAMYVASHAAIFSASPPPPPPEIQIVNGSPITFTIGFTPDAAGTNFDDILTIEHNATGSPTQIQITASSAP